jgi:hypothetical protein
VLSDLLKPILLGFASGLQFNPLVAVIGPAAAAGLMGHPKARYQRMWPGVAVVVAAWLAGDGFRVLFAAAHGGSTAGGWAALALWAVVGLAVGYAAPAAAGAYVGRSVTHGTGWLSAIFVAALVAGALTGIGSAAAHAAAAAASSL